MDDAHQKAIDPLLEAGLALGMELSAKRYRGFDDQTFAEHLSDCEQAFKQGQITAEELKHVRIQSDFFQILKDAFGSLSIGETLQDAYFAFELWSLLIGERMNDDRSAVKARLCKATDVAWLKAFSKTLLDGLYLNSLVYQALGTSVVRWELAKSGIDSPSKPMLKAKCIVRFPNVFPEAKSKMWAKIHKKSGTAHLPNR